MVRWMFMACLIIALTVTVLENLPWNYSNLVSRLRCKNEIPPLPPEGLKLTSTPAIIISSIYSRLVVQLVKL